MGAVSAAVNGIVNDPAIHTASDAMAPILPIRFIG
jgi:hypothetical protein